MKWKVIERYLGLFTHTLVLVTSMWFMWIGYYPEGNLFTPLIFISIFGYASISAVNSFFNTLKEIGE